MFLELGKALSLLACILSLYWAMLSAFFIPGSHWQERLALFASRIALAGCICFCSALLFAIRTAAGAGEKPSAASTLPMRLYLWAASGMAILFAVSWFLEEYYLPWALKS
jgi:hypothetical protein